MRGRAGGAAGMGIMAPVSPKLKMLDCSPRLTDGIADNRTARREREGLQAQGFGLALSNCHDKQCFSYAVASLRLRIKTLSVGH